jgi:hypothetical protein
MRGTRNKTRNKTERKAVAKQRKNFLPPGIIWLLSPMECTSV